MPCLGRGSTAEDRATFRNRVVVVKGEVVKLEDTLCASVVIDEEADAHKL
jgi:hypothetical protein